MAKIEVLLIVALALGISATARAQEDQALGLRQMFDARQAAEGGAFLPVTLSPVAGATSALVTMGGGYDTARSAAVASAVAEVRLWGPIALRGGAVYVADRNGARPTVGLRAQLLRQQAHGVNGSVSVFYKPEGFNEPEGEIETFLSVGRRFSRVALFGNLVYGQDPEGRERDGELSLALLYPSGRWTAGLDSRARFAIGQRQTAAAAREPTYDLLAGPCATVALGPLVILGEAGMTALRIGGQTVRGVVAVGGLGTVF